MISVVSAFLANVQMCFQGWVRSGWEGKGAYLSYKYVAAFRCFLWVAKGWWIAVVSDFIL